jgi:putative chitinase
MCIARSVGRLGINNLDDVKTVQVLINLNLVHLVPLAPLPEDGRDVLITAEAIEQFQARFMKMTSPNGLVEPLSGTLEALREGMDPAFSEDKLQGIFIHASEARVTRYFSLLNALMGTYSINTPLRMAHFLAQLGKESGELRYSEEIASGDAYEGRADLGNTEPGDGRRFKGRGLIQVTGRANYRSYGAAVGIDFTADANWTLLSTDPFRAVDASCWFWNDLKHLNPVADGDNVETVTRRVNGGLTGFAERKAILARAKFFLL